MNVTAGRLKTKLSSRLTTLIILSSKNRRVRVILVMFLLRETILWPQAVAIAPAANLQVSVTRVVIIGHDQTKVA